MSWSTVLAYPAFVLRLSRSGAQAGIYPRDMPNLRGCRRDSPVPSVLLGRALNHIERIAIQKWNPVFRGLWGPALLKEANRSQVICAKSRFLAGDSPDASKTGWHW